MANKLDASADAHSERQLYWQDMLHPAAGPLQRQGSPQAKPRLGRTHRVCLEGGRLAAAPWRLPVAP
jgi:hypothetical protein